MQNNIDALKENEIVKLNEIFKMLNNSSRLQILHILSQQSMSVDELKDALNMSQSAVSHQLRELRDAHLVSFEKRGKFSVYSLADKHVYEIYKQALDHVREAC